MYADVQVKLWDPLRTRAIPERLRGAFTTRRYINPRLPYLYLTWTIETFTSSMLQEFVLGVRYNFDDGSMTSHNCVYFHLPIFLKLPLLQSRKTSPPIGWHSLPTHVWMARLSRPWWLVTCWYKCPAPGIDPGKVTHSSTNRAGRRVTLLMCST